MKNIRLYIHIPFCKKKCKYCDFTSFAEKDELIDEYINCLCVEIKEVGEGIKRDIENKYTDEVEVKTIYIGGGTPSYIESKHIKAIMKCIFEHYQVEKDAEITIEINPGTVNELKLKEYKESGINRLSIGVQSTNNELLNMLGRIHNYEKFENTYKLARKVGFSNINIDFMLGLPNQTIKDIEQILSEVQRLNPEHISVYSLILEEDTPITKLVNQNKLIMPKEEIEREMYWKIKKGLEKQGYIHYEISNFSKKNMESKHNIDCWSQKEYMGFGAGAHSYMDGARFSNTDNIQDYIKNYKNNKPENNFILNEKQDEKSKMQEYMMLGLRKINGIDSNQFEIKFEKDVFDIFGKEIEKLLNQELIEVEDGYIRLSNKGIDLANLVWEEFI